MPRAAGTKGYYTIALLGPDGVPIPNYEWHFPSVTTVLDDVIAKPRLVHWYYTQTIDGIITLLEKRKSLPSNSKSLRGMLNQHGLSPYSKRNAAAKTGREQHTVFEMLAKGRKPRRTVENGAILDWWKDKGLTSDDIIATEIPLVSFKYGYAGTLDLIYRDPSSHDTVLCDLKTGSNIYWTHFLQGEAYRQAYEEAGNEVDVVSVLHAPRGGNYRECIAPGVTFNLFEQALNIWKALPDNWKPDDFLPEELGEEEEEGDERR